jgi:hypothetical protein
VVLGFCPCGTLRLNISPKKTGKNQIKVNFVSHTVAENLKQFAFRADKSRAVRRTLTSKSGPHLKKRLRNAVLVYQKLTLDEFVTHAGHFFLLLLMKHAPSLESVTTCCDILLYTLYNFCTAGFRVYQNLLNLRISKIVSGVCLSGQVWCMAAIQERVTAVLRSIPNEAFANSFQKLYKRCL